MIVRDPSKRRLARPLGAWMPLFVLWLACTPDRSLPGSAPARLELRPASASPAPGAMGVGLDAEVRLGVSGVVAPGSVGEAFALEGPAGRVAGAVFVESPTSDETTLVFVAAEPLPPRTTLRASVGTSLRDAWDRSVVSGYSWTFTTGAESGTARAAPALVEAVPSEGDAGVSTRVRPRLVFSHRLDALSVPGSVTLAAGDGAAVAVDLSVSTDGRVVTVSPARPLRTSTSYVLAVAAGLTSSDGTVSTLGRRLGFTTTDDPTAGAPPELETRLPAPDAVDVAPGTSVEATFTRPLDVTSLGSGIRLETAAGASLTANVSLAEGGRRLVLKPVARLPVETVVKVRLAGLRTDEGLALEGELQWSFTVSTDPLRGERPAVARTQPEQGDDDVEPGAPVGVTFTKPIRRETLGPTSVEARVSEVPVGLTMRPSEDGRELELLFDNLPDDVAATVTFTDAIEDAEGLGLEPYVLAFRTRRDVEPPEVAFSEPAQAAAGVALNAVVRFTIDEPYQPGSAVAAARSGDTSLSLVVVERPAERAVEVYPQGELPASSAVVVTLSGLRDARGNVMEPYELSFTTGAGPDRDPPAFDGLVRALTLDENRVRLEWNPALDVSSVSFLVWSSQPPAAIDFATTPLAVATGLATTLGGFEAANTYAFAVRARDGAGNVDANTVVRQVTMPDLTPPLFPGTPVVTPVAGLEALEISWMAASDGVTAARDLRYRVYVSTTSGGQEFTEAGRVVETLPGVLRAVVAAAPDGSGGVAPLRAGGRYFVVVRAVDAAGNESRNRAEGSAVVPDVRAPVFGGAVVARALSRSSVALSWTAATDDVSPPNALRYRVFARIEPEPFPATPAAEVVGATAVTLGSLTPDVPYVFRVSALDDAGNAAVNGSEPTFTLDGTPPSFASRDPFAGAPGASSPAPNRLVVGWAAASDEGSAPATLEYLVFRATSSTALFASVPEVVVGATQKTFTSVAAGSWFVGVRARDAMGNVDTNTAVAGPVEVRDPVPSWPEVRTALASCLGCHNAPGQWEGLSHAELVGTASGTGSCGGERLVVPGDLENSLFYRKILAARPADLCGNSMSANDTQRAIVRRWILGGAPE